MAPWWLRSSKDKTYEDELEIDDKTLDSIAIEPAPASVRTAPVEVPGEEEAFTIGWEPGERSEKPPAASDLAFLTSEETSPFFVQPPPEGVEDAGGREPEAAELEAAGREEPKPARKKRRRRRKKKKKPAEAPAIESTSLEAVSVDESRGGEKAAPDAKRGHEKAAPDAKRGHEDEDLAQEEIVFDFGSPERSATASDERKIALFCDLENIALGVRNSETKKFDINLVLERLLEKGKIIVKKAYADWERYADFKRPFHEAAIELIDIPLKHYSGKNSADIKMVVDAMDLCFSKEHLDTFVILSGDSDFSPLVSKLKENNKYVIGVGVKGSTSSHLIDNCDEFIYYEDVWRDLQRTPRLDHLSDKEAEVFELLIDSMLALIRENKNILWGSMIKQTMQRKRPSFSEGYYGYGSFSDLLEDARKKDIIRLKRDQRSGNYVITGFGQTS